MICSNIVSKGDWSTIDGMYGYQSGMYANVLMDIMKHHFK